MAESDRQVFQAQIPGPDCQLWPPRSARESIRSACKCDRIDLQFANSDLVWLGMESVRDVPIDFQENTPSEAKMFPIYERLPHLKYLRITRSNIPHEFMRFLPRNGELQTLELPSALLSLDEVSLKELCPQSVTSLTVDAIKVTNKTTGAWFWPELKHLFCKSFDSIDLDRSPLRRRRESRTMYVDLYAF